MKDEKRGAVRKKDIACITLLWWSDSNWNGLLKKEIEKGRIKMEERVTDVDRDERGRQKKQRENDDRGKESRKI